jgi:hypothetical protein
MVIVLNSDGSAEGCFLGGRFSDNLTMEIRPDEIVRGGNATGALPNQDFYNSSFAAVGFPKSIIYKRRPYLAHTLIAVASLA